MHLRVVTRKLLDGVEAEIPSIRECESWAKTEEEALANLFERLAFFLHKPKNFRHTLDISRKEDGETWFTLVIPD